MVRVIVISASMALWMSDWAVATPPLENDLKAIPDRILARNGLGPEGNLVMQEPGVSLRAQYVDANEEHGSVRVIVHDRQKGIWISTFWADLQMGSVVALQGKIFEVDLLLADRNGRDYQVFFEANKKSPLLKEISVAADTLFLPFDSHCRFRDLSFNIVEHDVVEHGKRRLFVRFSQQEERLAEYTPRLSEAQYRQTLSVGDVIRYDKYGLKIRNIVFPDPEKKIPGWVEVFDKELVFENEDAK